MVGRLYSCGFERDPDTPELHTQWVKNKINPFVTNLETDSRAVVRF